MTTRRKAPSHRARQPRLRRQRRGAATLVVVMVLFFIVALVSAYTSRNLIFEQRASTNQYRSTQAFEAAEAGLEWALTMLNSGRINAACQSHIDSTTTDDSFRQRYLNIDASTGALVERNRSDGQPLRAACVFDGTDWQCSCPVDGAPSLVEPTGPGPFPAFVLRFSRNDPAYPAGSGPYPAGVIRIESIGCTRVDLDEGCATTAASGDGRAAVTILAALKSALVTPPTAAVTVRLDLAREVGATAELNAVNSNGASSGITMHSGRPVPTWLASFSRPGTPGDQSFVESDAFLEGLSNERMFASVFGMARNTFRLQPATVFVDCSVDCSAATVRNLARLNPGRILWIEVEPGGSFDIDINDPIGSVASPVALVVNGDLAVSTAGALLHGVVYVVGNRLANSDGLTLSGALIAEGNLRLSGGGTSTIVYDESALGLLNRTSGSFVRVPGSWRDF